MKIELRGATEHNLQDLDVDFGDGLTVVTGISGSGGWLMFEWTNALDMQYFRIGVETP